jgi:hypothetical protein
MFVSTIILMVFLLAVLASLGRRATKRARSETPEQRAKRIRNENETAAILAIIDDDR